MKPVLSLSVVGILLAATLAQAANDNWVAKQYKAAQCSLGHLDQSKIRIDLVDDVLHFEIDDLNPHTGLDRDPTIETHGRWPVSGVQSSLYPTSKYNDPLGLKWANKKDTLLDNRLVSRLKNVAAKFLNKESIPELIASVYLSPNRKYAITFSNYRNTRIYDAATEALLAEIPYSGNTGGYQEGILSVSDHYFVLGESMPYRLDHPNDGNGPYATVRSFENPEKIIQRIYYGNQSIHGFQFTQDESKMVVTNLSYTSVIDMQSGDRKTFFGITNADDYISTTRLLNDHQLLIGFKNYSKYPGTIIRLLDIDTDMVSSFDAVKEAYGNIIAFTNPTATTVDVVSVLDINKSVPVVSKSVPLPQALIKARVSYEQGRQD